MAPKSKRIVSKLNKMIDSALEDAQISNARSFYDLSPNAFSCVQTLRNIKTLNLSAEIIQTTNAIHKLQPLTSNSNPVFRNTSRSLIQQLRAAPSKAAPLNEISSTKINDWFSTLRKLAKDLLDRINVSESERERGKKALRKLLKLPPEVASENCTLTESRQSLEYLRVNTEDEDIRLAARSLIETMSYNTVPGPSRTE